MITDKQKAAIRAQAVDVAQEDAQQNSDYLLSIIEAWVDSHDHIGQAEVCSSDRDMWPMLFDFNPETGDAWVDE